MRSLHRMVWTALCLGLLFGTAHADNGNTVALVMKALSNPFFSHMQAGARGYASLHNVPLEVFGTERETDVDYQIAIVENLIGRGYGAIVIAPADSERLVPVCKKAIDKGIAVINIDNPFHKQTLAQYGISIPFVGSDNSQGAGMVGEYIKKKLGGKGRVVVMEGIRGAENAELRKSGFIKAVASGSQIEVVASESANWHSDEAFAQMTGILKKTGKVDAIFCANDAMALGALQALDLLDLGGKVWIGAYDNIESVRNEMHYGRIHATIEQHPELMGQIGVGLAAQTLKGQKVPEYVPTPLDLITYETFEKRIAFSISDTENPFFVSLLDGVKKAADLFGVRLITLDSKNDDAQQLADVQSLIKQKVDALIINPTNTDTIAPGVELANAAGIPVITVDRKSSGGEVLCHITSDNAAGGRKAAEFLVGKLGGSGRVVEMEGIHGTSVTYERGLGFNEALSQYKGIAVVERGMGGFDREKAREAMEQILRKGTHFDAVFAHNDQMILGVIDALKGSGQLPVLVGFDGIPEAVEAIREGLLAATIAQEPDRMGQLAVMSAVEALRGESLPPLKLVDLELLKR